MCTHRHNLECDILAWKALLWVKELFTWRMGVHMQLPLGDQSQQVFLALWLSAICTRDLCKGFSHPKQVEISALVAEVSDSAAPCPAPLFGRQRRRWVSGPC